MPAMHQIYGLYDPPSLEGKSRIRYVGYTSKGLGRRLFEHLDEAKKKCSNHRHKWIRQLLRKGLTPEIHLLEGVTAETWQERERTWIACLKHPGLVNSTDGGEGLINPSAEVRERIRQKVKANTVFTDGNTLRRGIPHCDEDKKKISAGVKQSQAYQDYIESQRGIKRGPMPEGTGAKVSASKLGKKRKPFSDAWRENISAGHQGNRWITNGIEEKCCKAPRVFPRGWRFGRIATSLSNLKQF
jgi:hypothetical protein